VDLSRLFDTQPSRLLWRSCKHPPPEGDLARSLSNLTDCDASRDGDAEIYYNGRRTWVARLRSIPAQQCASRVFIPGIRHSFVKSGKLPCPGLSYFAFLELPKAGGKTASSEIGAYLTLENFLLEQLVRLRKQLQLDVQDACWQLGPFIRSKELGGY
jgi:hypothetical protein